MDPTIQSDIQAQFEASSEISLPNFLQPEKYQQVGEALKQISKCAKSWKNKGPANKRCYDVLAPLQEFHVSKNDEDIQKLNESKNIVFSCVKFLSSDATFLLMSNLTGLNFHPLATVCSEDDNDDSKSVTDAEDNSADQEEVYSNSKNSKKSGKTRLQNDVTNVSLTASTTAQKIKNENVTMDTEECLSKCSAEIRRWRQVKPYP